jgi:hypothetical protein
MIDANFEIDRLRQSLRFKNLSEVVIDSICDEVSMRISEAYTDIIADAMEEAVLAGQELNSTAFINEIKAVRGGHNFTIDTMSGKHDFSEPPFPMLPKLLKNAKTARDGSQYKVIPMRTSSGESSKKLSVTTEAALENINVARRKAKEMIRAKRDNRTYSSPDAMVGMDTFSAMLEISSSRQRTTANIEKHIKTEPIKEFRTASSKQDASTQWVKPGKEADMGPVLSRINAQISDRMDESILSIIREYEGMY